MNGYCMYGVFKLKKQSNEDVMRNNFDHARNFPQRLRNAWHSPQVLVYMSPLHATFLFGTSRYLCWFKSKMPTKHQSSRYQKFGNSTKLFSFLKRAMAPPPRWMMDWSQVLWDVNGNELYTSLRWVTWWISSKTGSGTPHLCFPRCLERWLFSIFLGER